MLFIYNSKVATVFYEPLVTDSFYRCNLGTVQRYLSTCYTEEGSILDHVIVTLTTVYSWLIGCCSVSLFIRWSHKMLIISSVGHTFTPHNITNGGKNG